MLEPGLSFGYDWRDSYDAVALISSTDFSRVVADGGSVPFREPHFGANIAAPWRVTCYGSDSEQFEQRRQGREFRIARERDAGEDGNQGRQKEV